MNLSVRAFGYASSLRSESQIDQDHSPVIAESTVQVPWAQFNEHAYDPNGPLPELGRESRSKFLVAMADGSVRTVKKSVSPNTLRAAITRAGNDTVGPDW